MIWQKVVTGIDPHLKVEIIRAAVSVKERASTDDWGLSLQLARRPRVATHQPARQPQEDSGKGLCGCNVDKPQRDIYLRSSALVLQHAVPPLCHRQRGEP